MRKRVKIQHMNESLSSENAPFNPWKVAQAFAKAARAVMDEMFGPRNSLVLYKGSETIQDYLPGRTTLIGAPVVSQEV